MCFGVYSLSNSPFDVLLMGLFGILGYGFARLECEPAPLILGLILGPMMEENLRRKREEVFVEWEPGELKSLRNSLSYR